MSLPYIRKALDTALAAMSPALTTVWPNDPADEAPAAPYQRADLMMGQPVNDEFGARSIKQGVYQITLCYPAGTNTAAADARADLIETTFYRGTSLQAGPHTVTVDRTPHIMPGYRDDGLWCVPVQIRFFSQEAFPRFPWLDFSVADNSQLLLTL